MSKVKLKVKNPKLTEEFHDECGRSLERDRLDLLSNGLVHDGFIHLPDPVKGQI